MWAESFVSAVRACGREDLLREFDASLLLGLCLVAYPRETRATLIAWRRAVLEERVGQNVSPMRVLAVMMAMAIRRGRTFGGRVLRKVGLRRLRGPWQRIEGGPDIEVAVGSYLRELGGEREFLEKVEAAMTAAGCDD